MNIEDKKRERVRDRGKRRHTQERERKRTITAIQSFMIEWERADLCGFTWHLSKLFYWIFHNNHCNNCLWFHQWIFSSKFFSPPYSTFFFRLLCMWTCFFFSVSLDSFRMKYCFFNAAHTISNQIYDTYTRLRARPHNFAKCFTMSVSHEHTIVWSKSEKKTWTTRASIVRKS